MGFTERGNLRSRGREALIGWDHGWVGVYVCWLWRRTGRAEVGANITSRLSADAELRARGSIAYS